MWSHDTSLGTSSLSALERDLVISWHCNLKNIWDLVHQGNQEIVLQVLCSWRENKTSSNWSINIFLCSTLDVDFEATSCTNKVPWAHVFDWLLRCFLIYWSLDVLNIFVVVTDPLLPVFDSVPNQTSFFCYSYIHAFWLSRKKTL